MLELHFQRSEQELQATYIIKLQDQNLLYRIGGSLIKSSGHH